MSHPKDPKLSNLGKQLLAQDFATQLTPESKRLIPRVESLEAYNKLKGIRVAPGTYGGTLLLQSYIGRGIRTFGSVKRDLFKAARIADLLTFRFGHLRLQRIRETADPDYNFSKAQATLDYANEPLLKAEVDRIADYLTAEKALIDPNNLSATVTVRPAAREKSQFAAIQAQLDRIEKLLNEKQT
jgi:hypothetical protein